MRPAELKARISERLDGKLAATGEAALFLIIARLISECGFTEEEIEENPMQLIAAYEGFRQLVGGVNRSRKVRKGDPGANEPWHIPGFRRLQQAYSIKCGEESWSVRIDRMSVNELLTKREELARMLRGLHEHVSELDRYINYRVATWKPEIE